MATIPQFQAKNFEVMLQQKRGTHLSPLFSFSWLFPSHLAPAKVYHWRKVKTGSDGKGINVLQGEACSACSLWQHAAAGMSVGPTVANE